jgi:hypothetical protein
VRSEPSNPGKRLCWRKRLETPLAEMTVDM